MSSNNPGRLPATYSKSLLSAMFFALIASTQGHAACVTPIESPSDATPSPSWNDVLTAKAQKSLNSVISQVQDIDATGTGNVNLDFYALTFDSMGMSAEWWSDNFRAHLNRYVYGGNIV